jgi:hypothetical protein
MKNLIHAAVVTLFAASIAHAQQAVQWKVEDGGNGHWYRGFTDRVPWSVAFERSMSVGGHLATCTSSTENQHVRVVRDSQCAFGGAWIGLLSPSLPGEPAGDWGWVTGEPLEWTNWMVGEPNGFDTQGAVARVVDLCCFGESWGDADGDGFLPYVVEWSADCNNDGVVDYGQCRDGTLPDYNGNNVPDCCERGEACVVGNYPVQWRVEDGGNGHWYQAIRALPIPTTFSEQDAFATSRGAVMATMSTSQENDFVVSIMGTAASEHNGAMFGLRRQANGGWAWCDQTPLGFTAWGGSSCSSGQYPNNSTLPGEMCGHLYLQNCGWIWDDTPPSWSPGYTNLRLLIEWSADCNQDGIVDYGQILTGQLADLDINGIPDICQQPTCADADLFRNGVINGADLGILLSEWGPAPSGTVSDINLDGQVNGADLGYLLNSWGSCGS